jgi:hypothetical protein
VRHQRQTGHVLGQHGRRVRSTASGPQRRQLPAAVAGLVGHDLRAVLGQHDGQVRLVRQLHAAQLAVLERHGDVADRHVPGQQLRQRELVSAAGARVGGLTERRLHRQRTVGWLRAGAVPELRVRLGRRRHVQPLRQHVGVGPVRRDVQVRQSDFVHVAVDVLHGRALACVYRVPGSAVSESGDVHAGIDGERPHAGQQLSQQHQSAAVSEHHVQHRRRWVVGRRVPAVHAAARRLLRRHVQVLDGCHAVPERRQPVAVDDRLVPDVQVQSRQRVPAVLRCQREQLGRSGACVRVRVCARAIAMCTRLMRSPSGCVQVCLASALSPACGNFTCMSLAAGLNGFTCQVYQKGMICVIVLQS